ncbi:terpene cyclase/mutase family protein [Candidatus Bathyarchaeota archaeon]|nr:MAG: terpene cyclase/mutase family protein [Candidatus Bathyarchaeota archaeon]
MPWVYRGYSHQRHVLPVLVEHTRRCSAAHYFAEYAILHSRKILFLVAGGIELIWYRTVERVTLPASKYPLNGAIWVIIILTLSIVSSTHYTNAATPSQASAAKSALNWLSINEKADGSFEDFPQIPTPGAALALWLNNSRSPQAAKSFNWIASQLDDSSSYAWGEADIPGVMLYTLGASNNVGLLHNPASVSSGLGAYQQKSSGFIGYYAQSPDGSYAQVATSVDTAMALWGMSQANSPISYENQTFAINYLLSLQNVDGRFNLTSTISQSSTDALGPEPISVTALVLLALRFAGKYTADDNHVSKALDFLANTISKNFTTTGDHKGHVYGAALSALAFQAYGRTVQALASVAFTLTQQNSDGSFLDAARGSSQKTLDTGWVAIALEQVQPGPLFGSFLSPIVFVGIIVAVGVAAVVAILAVFLVVSRRGSKQTAASGAVLNVLTN